MTLFNHEIEYTPVKAYDGFMSPYEGVDVRTAKIKYDNIFGDRCEYVFSAPAELWTSITVGGTMSTGGLTIQGVVCAVNTPRYQISTGDKDYDCYSLPFHEKPELGSLVTIFDHMCHNIPGEYGEFNTALVLSTNNDVIDHLNLHSINIVILNDGEQIGVIHIDPFTDCPNYDDCKISIIDGVLWYPGDFI